MDKMTLLIVEDEKLYREKLQSIPWGEVGVTEWESCADGFEAMERAKALRPDIVLSDIRMPRISGIELAQELSVMMPNTKILLLTAHDNFEFAREAVKYGVFEYILKPAATKEMLASIGAAVKAVHAGREQQREEMRYLNRLKEGRYFLKDYLFSRIASDGKFDESQSVLFENLSMQNQYCAVVISLLPQEEGTQASADNAEEYQSFLDVIALLNQNYDGVIPFYEKKNIVLFFGFDPADSEMKINYQMMEICNSLKECMDFKDGWYIIGVGYIAKDIHEIEYSYNTAMEAVKHRFYMGDNSIIFIKDVEPKQTAMYYKKMYVDKYVACVKIGDEVGAGKVLKDIFAALRENEEQLDSVQRICLDLVTQLSMGMLVIGQRPGFLFEKSDIWGVIKQYQTVEELEQFLCNVTSAVIIQINASRKDRSKEIVEKVKKLIQANNRITLNELAKQVFLSPCYLSTVFSKETGITIKNYLIQVRIERAKKLLETTEMPVYAIAEDVGYQNHQYFSALFQKSAGMLPSQYRTKHGRQSG